ncbi:putative amidase protein [Phaeoacremonium minimum UCRPA7]|uniref:Putative amidase protein n=1 Tax=Phaeoacremonium minimum (strain UCR-PA7) TaxID=1286976 RepID=R8BA57_PHAM7|nr:putative amidase protein [Phaeoacremonium minimum UCRPA7]EON96166.1 putative amidase protein [Phaeoacremonium minimum UCRPA7]
MRLRDYTNVFLIAQLVLTTAVSLSIVEATIDDLQDALSSGQINAVQLLAKYLHRYAQYDRRTTRLNSIPVINPTVFWEAQLSDEYRASTNGSIRSTVEGIPFTAKDSYMMSGLPVAAGSPAFRNLTATKDAFTVGRLRDGGAVALGKTNMPPMANGGMQRGVWGRADSPYNKDFLAAAIGSGSSNGCAASTAASLAGFGMGEETVSSGRAPASNNGLVAYTPSRGVLSIRGNWPLQPSADVVVPQARSVKDLMHILDILVATDNDTNMDFWRMQTWVDLPSPESVRPDSFLSLADASALSGKRIGVPRMFIGEYDKAAQKVFVDPRVRELWNDARVTLQNLGAIVEIVDFPAVTNFEIAPALIQVATNYPLPSYANGTTDPDGLDAYAWDDFLAMVNDTGSVTTLTEVDGALIFPQIPGTLPDRYTNVWNNRTTSNIAAVDKVKARNGTKLLEVPGLETFVTGLESRRKHDLEDWMDNYSLDLLVWPCQGGVGPQLVEDEERAAELAWRNGIARAFGNAAIRKLGIPTVSVAMGAMSGIGMPVDLTFAGKAYDDSSLVSYAYAFEQAHNGRFPPPRTPELPTDAIPPKGNTTIFTGQKAPKVQAGALRVAENTIQITGSIDTSACGDVDIELEMYLDGVAVDSVPQGTDSFSVTANITLPSPGVTWYGEENVPSIDLAMVVVLVTASNGRSDGKMLFV